MEQVQRILVTAVSNDVAFLFAIIIGSILFLAVLARFQPFARLFGGLERSGPALLTTLGVLGTFTGIFFGLLDFNVTNIDKSVPQLLVGLKIAFVTSILGMAAAIFLRIVQVVTPQPITKVAEVTPEVIHETLESIGEKINDASKYEQQAIDDLRKAISADSDSSLLTQVQKLRTDFKDGQSELVKEFREFSKTMAENNSKVLIEALEQVIREFNTQLNEQFGENFKQLNVAVGALLMWQENYRDHIKSLEQRFTTAVKGIEASDEALRNIVSHTEAIPTALRDMQAIVGRIGDVTIDLNSHLEGVSGLKDKALEAFPTIEENLKLLTEELTKSVRDAMTQSTDALQQQRDANNLLHKGFERLLENSRESQTHFENAISNSLQSMQLSLNETMVAHTQTVEVTANEMKVQISEALKKTSETIESQFEIFDRQMQQEITRSIETLGRNLASLSEKFVDDYTPLTNRLRDLVQLGGKV